MRRNLLLAAIVTGVFFLVIETALRVSGRVPTDALRSPDLETLDAIPGLFQPGQRLVDRIRPDLPYTIGINSLGFRGEEIPLAKRPGILRVLCLGDSYTFGHHVEDAEAFPAVLQDLLREAGHQGAEVINAGANGFTIVDEAILLKEKALAMNPDLVVLAFSQNDIQDLSRPRPMIESMREHARLKSLFVLGPGLKALQRTAIFNGMQRAAAWVRVRQRRVASDAPGEPGDGWRRYRDTLAEVARVTAGREARLLLVAWPSAEQAAGDAPLDPILRLERIADDLEIPFLDLTPALRGRVEAGGRPYLVPLDGHPSAEGHRVAAERIAARLRAGALGGDSR